MYLLKLPVPSSCIYLFIFLLNSTMTGPKPVKLRTKQLINRFEWQWDGTSDMDLPAYDDGVRRIGLAKTACVFVDAFTELFSCLLAGIPVVIPGGFKCPSEKCVADVQHLMNLVYEYQITHLTTVPAQLDLWLKQLKFKPKLLYMEKLESLRTVVVSGDILSPQLGIEFYQIFSPKLIRLINLYGTTEVTGDVSGMVFHDERSIHNNTRIIQNQQNNYFHDKGIPVLSVGYPIMNCGIYIVQKVNEADSKNKSLKHNINQNTGLRDSHFNGDNQFANFTENGLSILGKGQIGEVCITGLPVYKNSPCCIPTKYPNYQSLTSRGEVREKVFLTGDLGFIDQQNNQLYICGRSEEIIKINGIRFYPREVDYLIEKLKRQCVLEDGGVKSIESILHSISESVTLAIESERNRKMQLVTFFTLQPQVYSVDICTESTNEMHCRVNYYSGNVQLEEVLMNKLKSYLPSYLMPKFIQVS